jgi:hypothetical protein
MSKFKFFLCMFFSISLSGYMSGQLPSNYGDTNSLPQKMDVHVGLKGGLNVSSIQNGQTSVSFSPEMTTGYHLGVFANFHFGYRNEGSAVGTGYLGFQPEILFSREGFSANGEATSLNYIKIPLMFLVYPTKQLNIGVGPYFGYLAGLSPDVLTVNGAEITLSDLKNNYDSGIAVGLGYETSNNLAFNMRYYYGLSDYANNLDWKNQVLSLSIGYVF